MKKLIFSFVFIVLWVLAPAAYAADAIATATVNLRGGPGISHVKRGVIGKGTRLNIGHCQGNWCRVSSSRGSGWVSARYLAFKQDMMVRRHYRRPAPLVVMSFTIAQPRPYRYRTSRHRGAHYRMHRHRRHHGAIRYHRPYNHRFDR